MFYSPDGHLFDLFAVPDDRSHRLNAVNKVNSTARPLEHDALPYFYGHRRLPGIFATAGCALVWTCDRHRFSIPRSVLFPVHLLAVQSVQRRVHEEESADSNVADAAGLTALRLHSATNCLWPAAHRVCGSATVQSSTDSFPTLPRRATYILQSNVPRTKSQWTRSQGCFVN